MDTRRRGVGDKFPGGCPTTFRPEALEGARHPKQNIDVFTPTVPQHANVSGGLWRRCSHSSDQATDAMDHAFGSRQGTQDLLYFMVGVIGQQQRQAFLSAPDFAMECIQSGCCGMAVHEEVL